MGWRYPTTTTAKSRRHMFERIMRDQLPYIERYSNPESYAQDQLSEFIGSDEEYTDRFYTLCNLAEKYLDKQYVPTDDELTELNALFCPPFADDDYIQKERRKVTPKIRKMILERDRYTCRECGRYMPDGKDAVIDHRIPLARYGTSDPENLQVLCKQCNLEKSDKLPVSIQFTRSEEERYYVSEKD